MIAPTIQSNGGDEAAIEIQTFLAELGARPRGAIFKGRKRDENAAITNADLIRFHADGIVRKDGVIVRDITPNQEDSDTAAKIFRDRIENRLRILSKPRKARKIKSGKRKGKIRSKQKVVDAAAASALRAAALHVKEQLGKRVQSGVDNTGSNLTEVTDEYAEWRQDKYGIGPNRVFKATGQMLNNILDGSITIVKEKTLLDQLSGGAAEGAKAALSALKGKIGL
jgi:hypothetical protein